MAFAMPYPIKFPSAWVSNVLKADIPTSVSGFSNITTDSRTIQGGELFIPLKGGNFDGHNFITAALERGALACLSEKSSPNDNRVIQVGNVLSAYRELAAHWRSKFEIPVIAVAGSVGKTTTKELIATLLSSRFRVLKTAGSENGEIGLPKTLLKLEPTHQAAVIEIGIDRPGTMISHVRLVQPTHGIVTKIAEEHLENLINLETIAREECLVLEGSGRAFVNADDEWIIVPKSTAHISFGLKNKADIQGKFENGILSVPLSTGGIQYSPGNAAQASNALGAITISHHLGCSAKEITSSLKSFKPPWGRWNVLHSPQGHEVIFDAYNASPASFNAAFSELKTFQDKRPMIFILGDMLELGTKSIELHLELLKPILELRPERIFLLGKEMQHLRQELLNASLQVQSFQNVNELESHLKNHPVAQPSRWLIKGSRGLQLEKILPALELDLPK